jgi:hypothetical protein
MASAPRFFRVTANFDGRRRSKYGRLVSDKGNGFLFREVTRDGSDRWTETADAEQMHMFIVNKSEIGPAAPAAVMVEMRMNLHYGELENLP